MEDGYLRVAHVLMKEEGSFRIDGTLSGIRWAFDRVLR